MLRLVFEQVIPVHKLPPVDSLLPCVMGGGDIDLLCGSCRFPVAVGVSPKHLQGERFACPRCGCRNEVEVPEPAGRR